MKSIAIFACLLGLVAAENGLFEQYAEFMNTAAVECGKELKLGDDVVAKFRTEKESKDVETVGCLKACVLENFNMMKDGKLDNNMITDMINTVSADEPENAAKLKDITAKCFGEVEGIANKCELAMKFTNCCVAEVEKL